MVTIYSTCCGPEELGKAFELVCIDHNIVIVGILMPLNNKVTAIVSLVSIFFLLVPAPTVT